MSDAVDAAREQLAVDRKGHLAGDQRHQRIADGAARRRMRLAMACGQRQAVIVERLGLGHHDLGLRIARLHRRRDACDQAAAGGRRHHDVGREAERCHVLRDLAAGGALPAITKGSS